MNSWAKISGILIYFPSDSLNLDSLSEMDLENSAQIKNMELAGIDINLNCCSWLLNTFNLYLVKLVEIRRKFSCINYYHLNKQS